MFVPVQHDCTVFTLSTEDAFLLLKDTVGFELLRILGMTCSVDLTGPKPAWWLRGAVFVQHWACHDLHQTNVEECHRMCTLNENNL